MRAEWTPAVARALDAARTWATRRKATAPTPRHLLLGLLEEEEGRAAQLLVQAGLTIGAIRVRLMEMPESVTGGVPLEPIYSAAAVLAVERSGEAFVGSDHLLLALLNHVHDLRWQLEAAGLDLAALDAATTNGVPPAIQLDEPLDLAPSSEQIDIARTIDAAANRAREALRVVEDYCRFVLNDAFLCRELKTLRHDLVQILVDAGRLPLLEARDTLGDVGTTVTTDREQLRASPVHVVQANLKRLQEALRSLEEFGKLIRPDMGSALEQLRYRSYTLERAIVLGDASRRRLADARLYLLLTGSQSATSLEFLIEEAAAGGVDIMQLREKTLPDRELVERARNVRRWTRKAGVLFIVNDRPDIARLVEADGVHLGQDDLPVHAARRILGGEALIGISTHDLDQVHQAIRDGANYLGIGPVFPSATKAFDTLAGLDFVRQAMAETTLPAFTLGGITPENLPQVLAAGATRIAVSAAINQADEPRPVAGALRSMLPSPAGVVPPAPRNA